MVVFVALAMLEEVVLVALAILEAEMDVVECTVGVGCAALSAGDGTGVSAWEADVAGSCGSGRQDMRSRRTGRRRCMGGFSN